MPTLRMKERATICVLPLLLLLACTTTVTKIKSPIFAAPIDSLKTRLNGLIACEHVNLIGKEVTTNGKPGTLLEIDVLNGKDIPEDSGRMKTLAHSLAVEVKEALKDKNEYDNYAVMFVKVEKAAAVTKRSWKGSTFKSAEL